MYSVVFGSESVLNARHMFKKYGPKKHGKEEK